MPIEERRKNERRPFVKTVRYYLFYYLLLMEKLEKIHGNAVSLDISEGGLGMITDYPLKGKDILFFEHEIKVNDFVTNSAVVKWVLEIETNRYRVGLEFV